MQNDILPANTALVLIDIQRGFDDIAYWGGNRNNPAAEENAALLLQYWRKEGLPIFHINHASRNPASRLHPSHPGHAFKDMVTPAAGEPIITKYVNSAFIGTDLKEQLDRAGIRRLVIAGLTTDHCVSTTTRMAGNYGYATYLVADATATFDKTGPDGRHYDAALIHDTALASLHGEFAQVVNTNEMLQLMQQSYAAATV